MDDFHFRYKNTKGWQDLESKLSRRIELDVQYLHQEDPPQSGEQGKTRISEIIGPSLPQVFPKFYVYIKQINERVCQRIGYFQFLNFKAFSHRIAFNIFCMNHRLTDWIDLCFFHVALESACKSAVVCLLSEWLQKNDANENRETERFIQFPPRPNSVVRTQTSIQLLWIDLGFVFAINLHHLKCRFALYVRSEACCIVSERGHGFRV